MKTEAGLSSSCRSRAGGLREGRTAGARWWTSSASALARAAAVAVVMTAAGCASAPSVYREPAPLAGAARQARNREVFQAAWALVNERYYDPAFRGVAWAEVGAKYRPEAMQARDDDALYEVLNRMTAELGDPHVFAISPRQVHEGRQHQGVGFGFRERRLGQDRVIVEVATDSPAAREGVRAGWVLLAPTQDDLTAAVRAERAVVFSLRDEKGDRRTVSMAPALLPFAMLRRESRILGERVLYLRFDHFNGAAATWLSGELKHHRERAAVIVDLRANHGGEELALQRLVRDFFAEGKSLGRTVDRAGRARELPTLAVFPAKFSGKVVLLVDEATASSAEIFSHVLQFERRATLVGRRTAGQVVEGFRRALPDGGFINVAERDYRGVDGRRLEGAGVEPDVSVALPTLEDVRSGRDRDLEAALRLLE